MEVFKYREEYNNPKLSKFKEVTFDNNIYSLLAIFIIECLARTKGTKQYEDLNNIFISSLENWADKEKSNALTIFYNELIKHKTLVSRFNYISEKISSVREVFINFIENILELYKIPKKSNRDSMAKITEHFNIYISFREVIFPKQQSGTRLIGHLGIKDKSYLCIYYTESMINIDNSTETSVKYPIDIYYYTPAETEHYPENKKIQKVVSNDSAFFSVGRYETLKKDNLDIDDSFCSNHDKSQVMYFACGHNHCILCLYSEIQDDRVNCPCELEVSQKDLITLKKKALIIVEQKNKSQVYENQVSSNLVKLPPPSLLDKNIIKNKLDQVNKASTGKEPVINEKPLRDHKNAKAKVTFKTLPIECLNNNANEAECSQCKIYFHKSEFVIKCDCQEFICVDCRLNDLEKCFLCSKVYKGSYVIALKILRVTKINNY